MALHCGHQPDRGLSGLPRARSPLAGASSGLGGEYLGLGLLPGPSRVGRVRRGQSWGYAVHRIPGPGVGPFGVRVNAVAPGSFPDPEQMSTEAYQQRNAAATKTVPLGRVGRLKEVGYLAVFLASPAAAYVTGQTWAVDGGVSIQSA